MKALRKHYREDVVKQLMKQFDYANIMMVPKVTKVTLNMGVGEAITDRKKLDKAVIELTKIAGQKSIITYSRKSEAGFKIRQGWPIGCKVTMRGEHMYEFLERLIHITLPRVRDFRGLRKRSFDGSGNYNFGIIEQIVFPEINFDETDEMRGMDVSITTTARSNEEGYELLKLLKFPFREEK